MTVGEPGSNWLYGQRGCRSMSKSGEGSFRGYAAWRGASAWLLPFFALYAMFAFMTARSELEAVLKQIRDG